MLDALGINLKDLIFAIANFLILVLVLGKFLYKPFLGILEKRKQTIEDAFTNAEVIIQVFHPGCNSGMEKRLFFR